MNLAVRSHDMERLDGTDHDADLLRRSFDHIEQVNRWLGGVRVVREVLQRFPAADHLTVVDVGTGAADIPYALVRWAGRTGRSMRVLGVDTQRGVVDVARARDDRSAAMRFLVGDGRRLPLADKSVDVALTSLTLHHLTDEGATTLLAELSRVARRAVVVNDLERHVLNYLGARFMARTVWRSDPYTRHDGPLSVLRSFTVAELDGIGRAAGLRDVTVDRRFFYRLRLTGTPT